MNDQNKPVATFDGWIDNEPRIQWTGKPLPVGTALYAAPTADQHAAGSVEAERALFRAWVAERYTHPDIVLQHGYAEEAWIAGRAAHATAKPVAPAQPLIGKLLDDVSLLDIVWKEDEPGALVRMSDVTRVLLAAKPVAAGELPKLVARAIQSLIDSLEAEVPEACKGDTDAWIELQNKRRDAGIIAEFLKTLPQQCAAIRPVDGRTDGGATDLAAAISAIRCTYAWGMTTEQKQSYSLGFGDGVKAAATLAASAAQPAADQVAVDKTDANNYSRILSLLGMEEEGDPVAEVARLAELCALYKDKIERLSASAVQAGAVPDDVARLDWLRANCFDVLYPNSPDATWMAIGGRMGALVGTGNLSFREAIDAARAAAPTQPAGGEQSHG